MAFELDYDEMMLLDAEDLAEGGIAKAYAELLPKLREHVTECAEVEDVMDDVAPRYSVRSAGKEFPIYAPELHESEGHSWGRAAHALFTIVNEQLSGSAVRLFAINGGNDLGGMFLTQAQAEEARQTLPNKRDWPYIVTNEYPAYGQFQ